MSRFARGGAAAFLLPPVMGLLLCARADEVHLLKEYATDVWETADGLPQGTVTALAQTQEGYLWLGTPHGLVRFDGDEFQAADARSHTPGRTQRVTALLADGPAGLWVGLEDGGVFKLSGPAMTAVQEVPGLPAGRVRCLARNQGDGVMIGAESGFWKWNGRELTAAVAGTKPAQALLESSTGVLWVLANGAVQRTNGTTPRSVAGVRWIGMASSFADNVWLFTDALLLRISPDGTAGALQRVALEPGDAVTAVCERSNGELWLGTRLGVIRRLTGGTDAECRLFAGQPPCAVRCLLEDRERNLWIGTEGGGLVRMKPKRVLSYGVPDGLPGGRVTALCADGRQSFWVGCGRDGIARWEAGKFARFDGAGALPPDTDITALLRTQDGSLWIGAGGEGLWRWQDGKLDRSGPGQGLTERRVQAMVEMPDGSIVFGGAGEGIWQWSRAGGLRHYGAEAGIDGGNISSLAVATDGLWVGSNERGLYLFRDGRGTPFAGPDGPGSDFVRTLHADADDVLWIGTDAGLARLADGKFSRYGKEHGMWDNVISRIADDGMLPRNGGPNLWFGSNRGVFRLPKAAFNEAVLAGDAQLQPLVYGQAEGMECLECSGGFGPAGIVEHPTPNPRMENPRMWFPTLRGMVALDGIPLVGRKDGIMGDHIVFYEARLHGGGGVFELGDVAAGGDGTGTGFSQGIDLSTGMAVAGWNSLIAIDPAATVESRYHRTALPFVDGVFVPDGGVSPGRMVRISSTGLEVELPDTNGRAWGFLKSGAGVPPEEWFDPGEAKRLGPHLLWMPGNQGITFALGAIRQAAGRSVDRFSAKVCNLHVGSASYHVFVDGRLMARRSGLVRDFYRTLEENSSALEVPLPSDAQFLTIVTTDNKDDPMNLNPEPPPVIIEEVRENGQARRAERGTLVTGPGSSSVEFRYTALSLAAAEKVRFRYRLEPLEPEWIEASGRRTANYPGLDPGDYRFQVIACNNDGVWNETGATLALTVRPHFWETWWFTPAWIALLCAATGGGVLLALRARHRRRVAVLQKRHAVEEERARIARDIHDDLGASLTNIALLSDLALSDLDQPQQARTHLNAIFDAAHRVARSVDEIVWAINPRNDAVERSMAYICKSAQDFLRPSGLLCRLEMPAEFPACSLSSSVRHNLYLAVREALHNAVKHAAAREVQLKVSVSAAVLGVDISDNGRGFDPAAAPDGGAARHGISNLRERLTSVGGTFVLDSAPGEGTAVRLSVPLQMQEAA